MLGYRLIKVDTRPAQAWRELKEAANRLAENICEMVTSTAREAELVSGQRVSRVVVRKGDFRIAAERNAPFTPTSEAVWPRIHVRHEKQEWGKSLPDRPGKGNEDSPLWTHWPLTASQVRQIISVLTEVSTDDIQAAVDAALDEEGQ